MTRDQRTTVLAGDIGGTKTYLGLFVAGSGRPEDSRSASFACADAHGPEEIIIRFLGEDPPELAAACFGVAGPVLDGVCRTTNLPWIVSERDLADRFGWASVRVVNDLVATAYAIPILRPDEIRELNPEAVVREGNVALVAPGTGLGTAFLVGEGGNMVPVPSECGHTEFSPRTEDEIDLLRRLTSRFGHVSAERLLSGPGILTIYRWLRERGGVPEPPALSERLARDDPAKVIVEAALDEQEPICVATMTMFVSILGAYAGNLALTAVTVGGVYLGGGIPPRILPFLRRPEFMDAFTAKGRMAGLLASIPVRVILNDRAALLGAARQALQA